MEERHAATDAAIKHALSAGWRQIHVWQCMEGDIIKTYAGEHFPQDITGLVGNVDRADLGDGIFIDRTAERDGGGEAAT